MLHNHHRQNKSNLLALLGGLPLAYLAGAYIGQYGFSVVELLAVLIALMSAIIILSGERAVHLGFVLWILTLGMGYRTVPITRYLALHPAELLLWGLLGLLIIQRKIIKRQPLELWLPGWIWLLLPFWLWGWVPGLSAGLPWDRMLAEFRSFLLFIPLASLAGAVIQERTMWQKAVAAFFITAAGIAAVGIFEFFGFGPQPLVAADGFRRYQFALYGTPIAAFVIVLAVPLGIISWRWFCRPWQHLLIMGLLGMQFFGIYLGGYRNTWLSMGLMLTVWIVLQRKIRLFFAALILTPFGYPLLPANLQLRLFSLWALLSGHAVDSSGQKRWDRAQGAWDLAIEQPWGRGWSAAGWAHSDILQIAANLGLLAALLFVLAYLATVWRLWSQIRSYNLGDDRRWWGLSLLLAMVPVGVMLATQGIYVLPQLALPVWFIWILAELWLRQSKTMTESMTHGGDKNLTVP